jgi:hypothetical protein
MTEHFGPSLLWPNWVEWLLIIVVWAAVLHPLAWKRIRRALHSQVLTPGRHRLITQCPVHRKRAKLEVVYSEAMWGTLKASDVTRCSLFGPAGVSCEKRCLSHL